MNKFINVEYISPIVRFFFINLISILKKKKKINCFMNYESPCIRKKKFLLIKNFSTRLSKISFDLHDRRKIERCKMSDVSLIKKCK